MQQRRQLAVDGVYFLFYGWHRLHMIARNRRQKRQRDSKGDIADLTSRQRILEVDLQVSSRAGFKCVEALGRISIIMRPLATLKCYNLHALTITRSHGSVRVL